MQKHKNLTLEKIREWLHSIPEANNQLIIGIWRIKCLFQPSKIERFFRYNILIIQTKGQGACYYKGNIIEDLETEKYIGQKYNFKPLESSSVEIAVLDAIADSLSLNKPSIKHALKGNNIEKANIRAEIILNEVEHLASLLGKEKVKVCNIGVVATLLKLLLHKGYDVSASDMDKNIIGTTIFNSIKIEDENSTKCLIEKSDIAIVSGMVLSTNTFESIHKQARLNGTKLIIFAETGAAFASFYINNNYADVVVSEPFPFYTFNGTTEIKIYRNEI